MAVNFKILGWKAEGLRCPDHEISFIKKGNDLHKISLIQMPNGTGKTTTLKLLRAALAGPKIWNESFDKPIQFRKNNNNTEGKFELKLLYDDKRRLTIIIKFDFTDEGNIEYITTGPNGNDTGFNPPPSLISVLKPDFINLLIFDGELANHLLDSNHTNAQKAIEEMYQLSFLQLMQSRIDDYWKTIADSAGSIGSPREFKLRKKKVEALKDRIDFVTESKNKDTSDLQEVTDNIIQLENEFQQEIKKNKDDERALHEAEINLNNATQNVLKCTKEVIRVMKNPAEFSVSYSNAIISLKDSLDKVKLPGIAAREFFEEIADEKNCICGREITEEIKFVIRNDAKKYLGSEDVAVLNAMKSDIKERVVNNIEEEKEGDLKDLISELEIAQNKQLFARQNLDIVKDNVGDKDPAVKQLTERIKKLGEQKGRLEKQLEKYEDKTDNSDNGWNLDSLNRKYDQAEKDLAAATGTMEQKVKRDVLVRILQKAFENSRELLSTQVCKNTNDKIKDLMPNNNIRISSIDKCLKLEDKEGGSVGETLAVGYAFLSSLLSKTSHNLPSVVDSPSGPIDLQIRPEIAKLIPKLSDQFIAFVISSERDGFVQPLTKATNEEVYFLTLFRKGNNEVDVSAKKKDGFNESIDGIWVPGLNYFENFHTDKQD